MQAFVALFFLSAFLHILSSLSEETEEGSRRKGKGEGGIALIWSCNALQLLSISFILIIAAQWIPAIQAALFLFSFRFFFFFFCPRSARNIKLARLLAQIVDISAYAAFFHAYEYRKSNVSLKLSSCPITGWGGSVRAWYAAWDAPRQLITFRA